MILYNKGVPKIFVRIGGNALGSQCDCVVMTQADVEDLLNNDVQKVLEWLNTVLLTRFRPTAEGRTWEQRRNAEFMLQRQEVQTSRERA